jgi:nitrogen fixation NifU-like protein
LTTAHQACYADGMDQLYQERILAYARATRAMEPLDEHTHEASVSNPTCGDRVDIRLKIENGTVIAASAAIRGCALCEAGAGLLTKIAPQRQQQDLKRMRDALALTIQTSWKRWVPLRRCETSRTGTNA